MRLLVVEDNQAKAVAMVSWLADNLGDQFKTQTAPTLTLATAMLEQDVWDGILLDLAFQHSLEGRKGWKKGTLRD